MVNIHLTYLHSYQRVLFMFNSKLGLYPIFWLKYGDTECLLSVENSAIVL